MPAQVWRERTRTRSAAVALVTLGVGLALPGCNRGMRIDEGSYAGPSVRVEPTGGVWTVIADAPGAGWRWSVEGSRSEFGRERVFVSGQRPDPLFPYSSETVTQRIRTEAPTFSGIDVYVAVVAFDAETSRATYTRAVSAEAAEEAPEAPGASP